MPFGSKKAKTAASANKQQRVGLPDILLDAVVRHYGLLEAAAAGSDAGGGEGAPSGRVNQHDAHASAERERALLAATDDCIAYLAANPEFVARVTGRLRVNEQLQGRIDSLMQAVDEQKVAAERQGTGEGHCNLRVPNYALMLSVMTIINLQRKIDELQRTAAVGVVAAAARVNLCGHHIQTLV